jgi:hypothetical protein
MDSENVLTLRRYRFPVIDPTFRHVLDNGQGRPGWEFEVRTGPPFKKPKNLNHAYLFEDGVRFFAEGDPIPLPNLSDLTGAKLVLKEPFDPVSGEVYFTLYVCDCQHVSDLTLRFVERSGTYYRMTVSALAHRVFGKPVPLKIRTWIRRMRARRRGRG